MMNHEERIAKIIKLDLKLQCQGQVYVIITIHICLLKGTITVADTSVVAATGNSANKK